MTTGARSYCTFLLAGEPFALELGAVREVRRGLAVTPVRGGPPAVSGLANLRGRIATVLDPRAALGLGERGSRAACLVVLAGASELLALQVDEIGPPVELATAGIEPLPGSPAWLAGVAAHGDRSLRVLDAARILGGKTR